jgi:tRNA pseudouridine55 synthase
MSEIQIKGFPEFNFSEGEILLINKPHTWTSFDIVGKIRNAFKPLKLKVGHAGTLDPLASGLLIICTGKLTKKIDQYQAEEKEYTGIITLGANTPSYDMETEPYEFFDLADLNEQQIKQAATEFIGDIDQFPPIYSAIKIDGERLYEKARRGETIELPSRKVSIYSFEITDINLPEVGFKVRCSKGTYIRSLAYDFGKKLNNGAYLSSLKRTKSGQFCLEDAYEVMEIVNHIREIKHNPSFC